MKYLIIAVIAFCSPTVVFCQDITGLWKGTLFNDSTQQTLPYEVYINKSKGKYTGFSQTWFLVNGEKYYGIKKIRARIAKDGKVVIQDEGLMENNYPPNTNKKVIQLNVLDLQGMEENATLNGLFVTNSTRVLSELTGKISLKKITAASTESSLMEYLHRTAGTTDITSIK